MTNRSRAYFKECKRGKKAIAEGGYWIRQRKPVILFGGSFAEQRKWRKGCRNKLQFHVSTFDNTIYSPSELSEPSQDRLDAMFFLGENYRRLEDRILPIVEIKRKGDDINKPLAEKMLPLIENIESSWRKWKDEIRNAKPINQGENLERSVARNPESE